MKWEEARVWLVQRKDEAAASRSPVPITGTNEAAERLRRLRDETDWDDLGDLEPVKLGWRERWNITIVMVFAQSIQVLAVTLVMALFLLAFGLLTVDDGTLQAWDVIAENAEPPKTVLPPWSDLHLKVIALLAAFAGLTFAVYAALFRDQREIFFGEIDRKATQRLAVRALYRGQLL
jgi:hypothetical protein